MSVHATNRQKKELATYVHASAGNEKASCCACAARGWVRARGRMRPIFPRHRSTDRQHFPFDIYRKMQLCRFTPNIEYRSKIAHSVYKKILEYILSQILTISKYFNKIKYKQKNICLQYFSKHHKKCEETNIYM